MCLQTTNITTPYSQAVIEFRHPQSHNILARVLTFTPWYLSDLDSMMYFCTQKLVRQAFKIQSPITTQTRFFAPVTLTLTLTWWPLYTNLTEIFWRSFCTPHTQTDGTEKITTTQSRVIMIKYYRNDVELFYMWMNTTGQFGLMRRLL